MNEAPILHVSFVPDNGSEEMFPAILPMIGQMANFSNPSVDPASEPMDLYIHGHISSRLMRLPQSVETESDGLPLCVSATILDGIVLALTPFSHSCNYRSAVVFGHASAVEDEAEKLFAMKLITNGMVADRWDNARVPPTKTELQTTQILKIKVKSASAKIRAGGPNDDRKDLNNDDVTRRVWTGVIPIWQWVGVPQSGEKNKAGNIPDYLHQWRVEKNELASRSSVDDMIEKVASYLEGLFNIVYR